MAQYESPEDVGLLLEMACWIVVRHFGEWAFGRSQPREMAEGSEATERHLNALGEKDEAIRDLLVHAFHGMTESLPGSARVYNDLLAVTKELADRGRHELAQDLAQLVGSALDRRAEEGRHLDHLRVATYLAEGRSAGVLGRLDEAQDIFLRASRVAQRVKDRASGLVCDIRLAELMRDRGDLGTADQVLGGLVVRAHRVRAPYPLSLAHRARGATRQRRGDLAGAIEDYCAALQHTSDPLSRESVTGSLGACASDAGHFQEAGVLLSHLAMHARSPVTRGYALVNAMQLSVHRNDEIKFRHWTRTFHDQPPIGPAHLMGRLVIAQGTVSFHGFDRAREQLFALAHDAQEAKIFQVAHIAQSMLERGAGAEVSTVEREAPESLHRVVEYFEARAGALSNA